MLLIVVLGACTSGETPERDVPLVSAEDDAWMELSCSAPLRHLELIKRGYYPGRSPDVVMTPVEPSLFGGSFERTTHAGPWDYLQEVPLVFYGPGSFADKGSIRLAREVTVADIAPTLAELLDVPFPANRSGRPVTEALDPQGDKPRLIVVVVLDGGGWNALNNWPRSWPFMHSLMDAGTSIEDAIVGSSPSVTPPVHTTIGTGTFPNEHGIVDIFQRSHGTTKNPFARMDPVNLRVDTFADIYDRQLDNEPKVAMIAKDGWHVGMMGHGAAIAGGDKDIAVVETAEGEPFANTKLYELPNYIGDVPGLTQDIRTVDLLDGEADGRWRDYPIRATNLESVTNSPVRPLYQSRQLQTIVEREGFGDDEVTDLIFTNYKQIDIAGHSYNMATEYTKETIEVTDQAMESFSGFLDRRVGEGEWAMVLTADHGQGPAPELTGGWAIDDARVQSFVEEAVGTDGALFQKARPTGYWLDPSVEEKEATARAVANALAGYTVADDGRDIPEYFKGEPTDRLFESAFPMAQIDEVIGCARERV